MATVNEKMLDNLIRHKVMIERLSSGLANRAMQKITAKIKKDISIPDNLQSLSQIQLNVLANEIQKKVEDIILIEYDSIEVELKEIVDYEAKYIHNTAKRVVPATLSINTATMNNQDIIDTMKLSDNLITKDVFERLANKTSKNYKNVIIDGYRRGDGSRDVGQRLFNLERKGVKDATELKKLHNNLTTLSRTACNSINAEVSKEFFKANESVISGYLFTATLDGRTSTVCGSLDGQFFEKGQEPSLPLHYNCRSVLVPVLKSDADAGLEGTRMSMDGKVPKSQSYETWLRNQDREFVKEVLGEKRAKIFLNDNVPLNRFVDIESGKNYTLKQIAEREGIDISDFRSF